MLYVIIEHILFIPPEGMQTTNGRKHNERLYLSKKGNYSHGDSNLLSLCSQGISFVSLTSSATLASYM